MVEGRLQQRGTFRDAHRLPVDRDVDQLAEQAGLTLVGFLRGPSMNVYTGARRLSA